VVLSVFEFFTKQRRPGLFEIRRQQNARPVQAPQRRGQLTGLF
jgi:hypothetical protein